MLKSLAIAIVILILWESAFAARCHGKPIHSADTVATKLRTARIENTCDRPLKARESFEAALKLAETETARLSTLEKLAAPSTLENVLGEFAEFNYYRNAYKKAAELLNRLKSIKPLSRDHTIMLAESLYCSGERKQALPWFRQVVDLDSNEPRLEAERLDWERSTLAYLYIVNGKSKEAEELYDQAVQFASHQENDQDVLEKLHLDLAGAYSRAEQFDAATPILRKELANSESRRGLLDPSTCSIRLKLAKNYSKAGRFTDGNKVYQQLIDDNEKSPDQANALAHAASFFWEANRLDEAADALRQAVKLRETSNSNQPSTMQLKQNLATVLLQQGKKGEAKQLEKETALVLASDQDIDLHRHFNSLMEAGKKEEAISVCTSQLSALGNKRDPDSENKRNPWIENLGHLYCETGDFEKARIIYEQKYHQDPLIFHSDTLQKIYVRLGHPEKAELFLKEIIRLKNQSGTKASEQNDFQAKRSRLAALVEAKNNLASFYFQRNQLRESEAVVRSALKDLASMPRISEANILNGNLAVLCSKQKRFAEAQRILENLRNQLQNDPYDDFVHHDPVAGFSTTGVWMSSSGSEGLAYKTDSGASRVDPILYSWRWEAQSDDAKLPEDEFPQSELWGSRRLPLVDWYKGYFHEPKEVLRALTKLALFNLYTKMGRSERAQEAKQSLMNEARALLNKNLHDDACDQSNEFHYEQILKRFPQTSDVLSLEANLKRQRLARAEKLF